MIDTGLHQSHRWARLGQIATIAVLLLFTIGCAQQSYINISYRLPSAATPPETKRVVIATEDRRSQKEIFNPRAKEKFEHFTGLFALALERTDQEPEMLGAYQLPSLFETALMRRLAQLGIEATVEAIPDLPRFTIAIRQFQIHLVGQKWLADISYEVTLVRDENQTASETVAGSAERLKLLGSGGAEKVVGEIFTEMINRLDIERLFEQAGL